jgi:lipopolysaccharide transport system permease protein
MVGMLRRACSLKTITHGLWTYRGFITGSVKREFQARYRNSLLGAAWIVLQPLSMILVYTLIFSKVMQAKVPGVESSTFTYSIYLCSGILTWGLFSDMAGRAQGMFLENANLIKKLNFPTVCLPTIVVLSALSNFAIIFALFLVFLLLTGTFPGWIALAALPLLALQIAFAIGLGLTLGILHVFFRDVGQLFSVGLFFWFWLTPIVYPLAILPESLQRLIRLNPMTGLIEGYHRVMVERAMPNWSELWLIILLSAALMALAARLYQRRAAEIVDEL